MLRDVDIKTALMVPDNDDGVEMIIHLQEPTSIGGAYGWYTFSVESLADSGEWTVHCDGRISVSQEPTTHGTPVDESILTQRVSGKRWYDAFHRVGFYYGRTFQHLQQVRTGRSVCHAAANVTVREDSGDMKGESRYLVHPSTIDACLQLIIISIHAGKHKEMPWGVVPTRIEEISLFPAGLGPNAHSAIGQAIAWTDGVDGRRFNTNGRLKGADNRLLLDIKNLICIAYDAALPADSTENKVEIGGPGPFSVVNWRPDIEDLDEAKFSKLWPEITAPLERLAKCVELIHHRQAFRTALIISRASGPLVYTIINTVLGILPHRVAITIGIVTEVEEQAQELTLSEETQDRVSVITLSSKPESWSHGETGPYDLVLADPHCADGDILSDALSTLVKEGGWLLGSSAAPLSPLHHSAFTLQMGQQFASLISSSKASANGTTPYASGADEITILSAQEGGSWYDIQSMLSGIGGPCRVRQKSVKDFCVDEDNHVVIDDTMGVMSASMLADSVSFEAIKAVLTSGVPMLWITSGARQGCASAVTTVRMGMAEGLLRVLRSEQAASRIVLLDFDLNEEPDKIRAAIISRLKAADIKDSGHDTEFWLHRGVLHTSRVCAKHTVDHNPSEGQHQEKPLDGALRLSKTTNSQFIFEDEEARPTVLNDDEIELQVSTSQWPSFSHESQLLVGGTIIRVGSSENRGLVGKSAITFVYDEFQTVVQTPTYAVVDEAKSKWTSLEVLIGILPSLYPIVQLCLINANLEKGDSILSLPGPDTDVSILAKLARLLDWNISVVVHSASEREWYISRVGLSPEKVLLSGDIGYLQAYIQGQQEKSSSGTITIIGHEFGSLSQEIWRNIPESSRFMLWNKSSLESVPLDPLPFSRGASFVSSNMKSLRRSPKTISKILKLSLELLKTHSPQLVDHGSEEINVVDIQDARNTATVPSDKQNAKTTVVRYRQGKSQIKVCERIPPLMPKI